MDRRDVHRHLVALALAALPLVRSPAAAEPVTGPPRDDMMATMRRFIDDRSEGDPKAKEMIAPTTWRQIGMLAFPGMFPLDLLGPKAIFEDLLNTHVRIIDKTGAGEMGTAAMRRRYPPITASFQAGAVDAAGRFG